MKQPRIDTLTNRTNEEARDLFNNPSTTLSTFSICDSSNCSQADRERGSQCGHDSRKLVEQDREQPMHCGECQEKPKPCLNVAEERQSFLDGTELKNKVSPDANFRSHFLSSMDDGKFCQQDWKDLFHLNFDKRGTSLGMEGGDYY